MAGVRHDLDRRHTLRVCCACGYRGRELQGERGLGVFSCPSCGGDLYARPARSYAELEGFIEAKETAVDPERVVMPLSGGTSPTVRAQGELPGWMPLIERVAAWVTVGMVVGTALWAVAGAVMSMR
jgi:hypothetical protein